jgi:hypothetical protein
VKSSALLPLCVLVLLLCGAHAGSDGPLSELVSSPSEPMSMLSGGCPIEINGQGVAAPPVSMEQSEREQISTPRKDAWERSVGGRQNAQAHLQARLKGWPSRVLADRASLPKNDREFLRRVAADTWQGLDALSDRENGLPIDHVRFSPASTAIAESRIADYTSGTNIGLYLTSVVAAADLGLVSEPAAVELIGKVLDTLERLESHRGFLFNFYDTTSLERTTHFISFVDSAWLAAGLIVVRGAFPALHERCSALLREKNFAFFYDAYTGLMFHGYDVDRRSYAPFHYGALYSEARLGSLIAIGKGDVPEEHWFRMRRVFPDNCAWQTLVPQAIDVKRVRGHEVQSGYYEWKGLKYVPSWGGSMFEALMPVLFLDEPRLAPHSLGRNDEVHARLQEAYARDDLDYPVWGMSPSSIPGGDGYAEYGVPPLGSRGYEAGAVTPHASALALAVTPGAAIANLRRLVEIYDIYGEYGFYDAVDPRTGLVAYEYFVLDQTMLFIALANHLNNASIQRLFAADPICQEILPLLREEDFRA